MSQNMRFAIWVGLAVVFGLCCIATAIQQGPRASSLLFALAAGLEVTAAIANRLGD